MSYYGDFVVPTVLAQPSDLAAWTGEAAPANATQLLRSATMLILWATVGDYYTVDPTTGIATSANIQQAMQDAVCIQAAAWSALGYDPNDGGVLQADTETSVKIGTAQIVYADAAAAALERAEAYRTVVPEAVRRLRQVGMLHEGAWTFG